MTNNRLAWHLEDKHLLSNSQTGFRRNKSTIDQILKLSYTISKRLRRNHSVIGVFLDIEKAYDMMWTGHMLNKLLKMQIGRRMFDFIKDFVSNRSFHVKVGGEKSTAKTMENGTPHGSVISTTLFLIMINDLATKTPLVDL